MSVDGKYIRYDFDSRYNETVRSVYISMKNTAMPGDGEQNAFHKIYHISNFDASIYRNFRYDIQH